MKKRCFIWILSMLMISVSVLGQDVRYNFDKDTNFAKFKAYEWVAIKDAKPVDDLTDKQIKEALDAQLATKGLSKVEGDNADLFVAYQAAIGSEKQFTSYNTGWGYGPGWYGGGWYGGRGGGSTRGTPNNFNGQVG